MLGGKELTCGVWTEEAKRKAQSQPCRTAALEGLAEESLGEKGRRRRAAGMAVDGYRGSEGEVRSSVGYRTLTDTNK